MNPATLEQVPGGYWEGATFTETKLFSEIHAPNGIAEHAVPTSETSVVSQKNSTLLVS